MIQTQAQVVINQKPKSTEKQNIKQTLGALIYDHISKVSRP